MSSNNEENQNPHPQLSNTTFNDVIVLPLQTRYQKLMILKQSWEYYSPMEMSKILKALTA